MDPKRSLIGISVGLLMAIAARGAVADVIVGVTATAATERVYAPWGQDRAVSHTVDGSGLDAGTGGHTTVPDGFMWLSENGAAPGTAGAPVADQWIKFDLGALFSDVTMRIWNYNETLLVDRGLRDMVVLVSATDAPDIGDWVSLGPTTLAKAPGDSSTDFSETFSLGTGPIRYVYFDIGTNHGSSEGLVGLSEVQFTPEPATLSLLTLGAFALLRRRK